MIRYPLCDCLQIFPRKGDYDVIVILYYTDNPSRAYDAFVRKHYNIPKDIPLYLCMERWEWDGSKYIKTKSVECLPETIDGEPWCRKVIKKFSDRYLRFIVPAHEFDFSHVLVNIYTPSTYYNLRHGCRWNRAWASTE